MATHTSVTSLVANRNVRNDLCSPWSDIWMTFLIIVALGVAAMGLSGEAQIVHDEWIGRERYTAVSAWARRWWHWGGRGVPDLFWYSWNIDLQDVRCCEEVGHEQRLAAIGAPIYSIDEDERSLALDDVFALSRPYDQLYSTAKCAYWACNIDIECHMPSSGRCVFLGWNSVKVLALCSH